MPENTAPFRTGTHGTSNIRSWSQRSVQLPSACAAWRSTCRHACAHRTAPEDDPQQYHLRPSAPLQALRRQVAIAQPDQRRIHAPISLLYVRTQVGIDKSTCCRLRRTWTTWSPPASFVACRQMSRRLQRRLWQADKCPVASSVVCGNQTNVPFVMPLQDHDSCPVGPFHRLACP